MTLGFTRYGRDLAVGVAILAAGVVSTSTATAGPVVREAAGANAAAIQTAVDQFRTDLGGANNGTTLGSQLTGRREISWDGGGDAALATTFPSPMDTFANRGAVFVTPGTGFAISGQPSPEFGDLNPAYPAYFTTFSSPRLFTALNTNVMDVWFFVPGDGTVPAAVTGFGSVFTDVDSPTSTKLEFYAPDGALLYEHWVPAIEGDETLSFLGVSFDAGEVVGRVRIVSGNAALGPDETGDIDLVAMDDFIYGEPVSTLGLRIAPSTSTLSRRGAFDILIDTTGLAAGLVGGQVTLDGLVVTQPFLACVAQAQGSDGTTFRCPIPRGFLPSGDRTLQVQLELSDGTRVRNAVRWTIVP
jgi:hypothetical protein